MEDKHCSNYDPFYEGCIACPGKLNVVQQDGTVNTICRAGESRMRSLLVQHKTPVDILPFPASERPRPA